MLFSNIYRYYSYSIIQEGNLIKFFIKLIRSTNLIMSIFIASKINK